MENDARARVLARCAEEPNMAWEIVETGKDRVDALALIGSCTFLETFAGVLEGDAIIAHCERKHSASAYAKYLRDGATAWLALSAIGGAPIGFALLDRPELPGMREDESDLELKRIYVLSRFHGDGLGASLMDHAAPTAKVKGAQRLLVGAYAGHTRALAFYSKNGFYHIADRRFRVGDTEYDDVVLAKLL